MDLTVPSRSNESADLRVGVMHPGCEIDKSTFIKLLAGEAERLRACAQPNPSV
jgi:hypothetical protein